MFNVGLCVWHARTNTDMFRYQRLNPKTGTLRSSNLRSNKFHKDGGVLGEEISLFRWCFESADQFTEADLLTDNYSVHNIDIYEAMPKLVDIIVRYKYVQLQHKHGALQHVSTVQ